MTANRWRRESKEGCKTSSITYLDLALGHVGRLPESQSLVLALQVSPYTKFQKSTHQVAHDDFAVNSLGSGTSWDNGSFATIPGRSGSLLDTTNRCSYRASRGRSSFAATTSGAPGSLALTVKDLVQRLVKFAGHVCFDHGRI